jgi:F-type H+-transporting ATPase subunit delta
MIDDAISENYAAALFASASEAGLIDTVKTDLSHISSCIEEDPSVFLHLSMPSIRGDIRISIIEKAFSSTVHTKTMNFLKVTARNNRLDKLGSIIEAFILLVKKSEKISDAFVESASTLDNEEKDLLKLNLEKKFDYTFNMHYKVKPELLGGFTVRIDSQLIDKSITGALKEMRLQLKQCNITSTIGE